MNMDNIFKELYLAISESKLIIKQSTINTDKVIKLYDLLKSTLTKEQDEIFENFLRANSDVCFEETVEAFERGIKLGIKLCN